MSSHKSFLIAFSVAVGVFVGLMVIQFMQYDATSGSVSLLHLDNQISRPDLGDLPKVSFNEFIQKNEFPYLLEEDGTIRLNINP